MMGTSLHSHTTRFLTFLLFIVFPIYIALNASSWLSDVGPLLSPLSERAKAVHVALTSPLATPLAAPIAGPRAPISKKSYLSSLPDGIAHSINSLEQYPFLAEEVLQRKHARYAKQTPAHKAICNKLGYPAHFENARKGIDVNAHFAQKVAQMAREAYSTGARALEDEEEAEYGLVNEMFGHLVRDWSTQGAKERQIAFPPLLDGLEQHFGSRENGRGKKVLVPGSGMGRLASDIADIGMSPRHLR
jgi:hypothetical protein